MTEKIRSRRCILPRDEAEACNAKIVELIKMGVEAEFVGERFGLATYEVTKIARKSGVRTLDYTSIYGKPLAIHRQHKVVGSVKAFMEELRQLYVEKGPHMTCLKCPRFGECPHPQRNETGVTFFACMERHNGNGHGESVMQEEA